MLYSRRYKINLYPQYDHYLQHTPQVHTLTCTGTQNKFSPCASTVSCRSLEGERGCVCSEELSELDGNPMARELCRPISPELGGELVAAKHSFLSRGSGHLNLTSLGKCPQFRCDP